MRAVLPTLLLASCSLTTFSRETCTNSLDCRSAFGNGSVCGELGFCEDVTPIDRCPRTIPDDFYSNLDAYREASVLGVMFDVSTDNAQLQAAELAFEQAEREGLPDGLDIVQVYCDYQPDLQGDGLLPPAAATSIVQHLLDDVGAVGIVGPATSDPARNAQLEADGRALIMSPSASADSLSFIDGDTKSDESPGSFWRTVSSDAIQGDVIVLDMMERGVSDIGVIYQESSYASALTDAVLEGMGGGGRYPFTSVEEQDQRHTDAGLEPHEEVMFVSSDVDDAVRFMTEIWDSTLYEDKTIFLTDATADQFFLEETAIASSKNPDVRGTRPALPAGQVFEAFAASYENRWGEDARNSVFAAYTYDAAWLVVYGLVWAHEQETQVDATGMGRGLRKVVGGTAVDLGPNGFSQVKAAFAAGNAVDLEGTSGGLDYDLATEELENPVDVWRINADHDTFCVVATCTVDACTPVDATGCL